MKNRLWARIMFTLILLLTSCNTLIQTSPETLTSSDNDNINQTTITWQSAYAKFLYEFQVADLYENTGEYTIPKINFHLYDINKMGTPELIIGGELDWWGHFLYYVYTFDGNNVNKLGYIEGRSYEISTGPSIDGLVLYCYGAGNGNYFTVSIENCALKYKDIAGYYWDGGDEPIYYKGDYSSDNYISITMDEYLQVTAFVPLQGFDITEADITKIMEGKFD